MRQLTLSLACLLTPALVAAQGFAASPVSPADGAHADHATLHEPGATEARVALVAAEIIGLDDDAAALCHAAELALTIGLLTDRDREAERIAWFGRAEDYARRAAEVRPGDPEPLFLAASALGLRADYMGLRDRIAAGGRVFAMSDSILEMAPGHPGGLHIQGRLAASAMRLPGVVRFMVVRFLGAEVLRDASWSTAETWLRDAAEQEPTNPVFRLELATALRDAGHPEAAREELERVLSLPSDDPLNHYYQQRARRELAALE